MICLLEEVLRPDGNDEAVIFVNGTIITSTQPLPIDLHSDFYRLSCFDKAKIGLSEGQTVRFTRAIVKE